MKVLIDTNIILDVLSNRKPFVTASKQILRLCEISKINGYTSALSIMNIVYILRKELDNKKIKTTIDTLNIILKIEKLDYQYLNEAVSLNFDDFEDAVQSITAKKIKADYIITRNCKDFIKSPVPAITPEQFLKSNILSLHY